MTNQRIPAARAVSLLAPPLAVMAVIFLLSSQQSSGDHGTVILILRKIAHVTEYTVLALCWIRALAGLGIEGQRRSVAAGIGLALVYAGTDEFHQTFVAGRHGTPVDVLIDSIGLALAAVIATRWQRRKRRPGRTSGATPQAGALPPERGVGERLEGAREIR